MTTPLNVAYTIFSHQFTQLYTNAITVQTPLCAYDVDFTFASLTPTPSTAFIAASTFNTNLVSFDLYSLDRYNQGSYSVSFSATLNSYTYAQNPISNTITIDIIDPCYDTTILPITDPVEDFTAFEGFATNSQANYTYYDTVSDSSASPTPICGALSYRFAL